MITCLRCVAGACKWVHVCVCDHVNEKKNKKNVNMFVLMNASDMHACMHACMYEHRRYLCRASRALATTELKHS